MIRQRKFKPGDIVRLSKLAVIQNQYSPEYDLFKHIFEGRQEGKVVRIEEMLPGNSNFRYSVKFKKKTITLNETQIEFS